MCSRRPRFCYQDVRIHDGHATKCAGSILQLYRVKVQSNVRGSGQFLFAVSESDLEKHHQCLSWIDKCSSNPVVAIPPMLLFWSWSCLFHMFVLFHLFEPNNSNTWQYFEATESIITDFLFIQVPSQILSKRFPMFRQVEFHGFSMGYCRPWWYGIRIRCSEGAFSHPCCTTITREASYEVSGVATHSVFAWLDSSTSHMEPSASSNCSLWWRHWYWYQQQFCTFPGACKSFTATNAGQTPSSADLSSTLGPLAQWPQQGFHGWDHCEWVAGSTSNLVAWGNSMPAQGDFSQNRLIRCIASPKFLNVYNTF